MYSGVVNFSIVYFLIGVNGVFSFILNKDVNFLNPATETTGINPGALRYIDIVSLITTSGALPAVIKFLIFLTSLNRPLASCSLSIRVKTPISNHTAGVNYHIPPPAYRTWPPPFPVPPGTFSVS